MQNSRHCRRSLLLNCPAKSLCLLRHSVLHCISHLPLYPCRGKATKTEDLPSRWSVACVTLQWILSNDTGKTKLCACIGGCSQVSPSLSSNVQDIPYSTAQHIGAMGWTVQLLLLNRSPTMNGVIPNLYGDCRHQATLLQGQRPSHPCKTYSEA